MFIDYKGEDFEIGLTTGQRKRIYKILRVSTGKCVFAYYSEENQLTKLSMAEYSTLVELKTLPLEHEDLIEKSIHDAFFNDSIDVEMPPLKPYQKSALKNIREMYGGKLRNYPIAEMIKNGFLSKLGVMGLSEVIPKQIIKAAQDYEELEVRAIINSDPSTLIYSLPDGSEIHFKAGAETTAPPISFKEIHKRLFDDSAIDSLSYVAPRKEGKKIFPIHKEIHERLKMIFDNPLIDGGYRKKLESKEQDRLLNGSWEGNEFSYSASDTEVAETTGPPISPKEILGFPVFIANTEEELERKIFGGARFKSYVPGPGEPINDVLSSIRHIISKLPDVTKFEFGVNLPNKSLADSLRGKLKASHSNLVIIGFEEDLDTNQIQIISKHVKPYSRIFSLKTGRLIGGDKNNYERGVYLVSSTRLFNSHDHAVLVRVALWGAIFNEVIGPKETYVNKKEIKSFNVVGHYK